MIHRAVGMAAVAGLVLAAAVPANAQAAEAAPAANSAVTAACALGLGSFDTSSGVDSRVVSATAPPAVSPVLNTPDLYTTPYAVFNPTTFTAVPAGNGRTTRSGKVVWGAGYLMESTYTIGSDGKIVGTPVFKRIGNGWGGRYLIQAQYKASATSKPTRTMLYSLDQHGKFGRWTDVGQGFRNTGYLTGMSGLKSLALIATTPTYDMFLANNRAGGLYTVKIPTSVPLKVIVAQVRTSSWQIFETLVAAPCGQYGSILLGIDRDTKSAYLYAVGHANGASTVIKSLGKAPAAVTDWEHFRFAPAYDPLNGG